MTITVRETKTERLTPVNQNYQSGPLGNEHIERQIIQNSSSVAPRASSATKELDDLMASLSDFKVRSNNRQC